MKTPCQDDPEMWVSDQLDARVQAASICISACPKDMQRACAALAIETKPKLGVYAGRDFTKRTPTARPTKKCEGCQRPYERHPSEGREAWTSRRFCSRKCAALHRKEKAA
jgi:hypothetical protein